MTRYENVPKNTTWINVAEPNNINNKPISYGNNTTNPTDINVFIHKGYLMADNLTFTFKIKFNTNLELKQNDFKTFKRNWQRKT